jgi:superfamily I DNA and/or RNA helicase
MAYRPSIKWIDLLLRTNVTRAGDISIITLESKDKRCLRRELTIAGIDVEVGVETSTVDAFQGREKEIIIIHYVNASHNENP